MIGESSNCNVWCWKENIGNSREREREREREKRVCARDTSDQSHTLNAPEPLSPLPYSPRLDLAPSLFFFFPMTSGGTISSGRRRRRKCRLSTEPVYTYSSGHASIKGGFRQRSWIFSSITVGSRAIHPWMRRRPWSQIGHH